MYKATVGGYSLKKKTKEDGSLGDSLRWNKTKLLSSFVFFYSISTDSPFGEQIPQKEKTHSPIWEHILQTKNVYCAVLSSIVFFFSIANYYLFGEQIPWMENIHSPNWYHIHQMEKE